MKKTIYTMPTFFYGALLSMLVSMSSLAEVQSIDVGINIGDKAKNITVLNTSQKHETIKSLSGKEGLILVFFRSADWCPFCKKHLLELNEYADKFTSLGYNLAGVSYDSTEVLQQFSTEFALKFPLLSDQNAKTFTEWGIMNKQYSKDDEHYGIPYPGVVIIDENGVITHRYFYQGYKKRAKFDVLYQQLK